MLTIISKENSLAGQFISELRNIHIQQDRMRFRRNMERIGEIFAYEISKKMQFKNTEVTTPLGVANCSLLASQPVVASILRAGLPLHQGVLNYFDQADNAFVSAYRKHHKDGTFDIKIEYLSSPIVQDRILILSDPMLATGTSMVLAYKALLEKGKPSHTYIISALASSDGVAYVKSHLSPNDVSLWVGAVDAELTAQSFIVPGLGDAGDLAFGGKK
jgi:uracil phosphoribosyltransferase